MKTYSPAADQDVIQKPWLLDVLLRKEVIQPLVLERLPCYDFTPIIEPTFGRALLAVRLRTSGVPDSHGVTAVSYTHLIALTNQLFRAGGIQNDPGFQRGCHCKSDPAGDIGPVSYTHLDVYKRQYIHQRDRYGKARSISAMVRAQTISSTNSFLWGLK